jgi:hypothetical protein
MLLSFAGTTSRGGEKVLNCTSKLFGCLAQERMQRLAFDIVEDARWFEPASFFTLDELHIYLEDSRAAGFDP